MRLEHGEQIEYRALISSPQVCKGNMASRAYATLTGWMNYR